MNSGVGPLRVPAEIAYRLRILDFPALYGAIRNARHPGEPDSILAYPRDWVLPFRIVGQFVVPIRGFGDGGVSLEHLTIHRSLDGRLVIQSTGS